MDITNISDLLTEKEEIDLYLFKLLLEEKSNKGFKTEKEKRNAQILLDLNKGTIETSKEMGKKLFNSSGELNIRVLVVLLPKLKEADVREKIREWLLGRNKKYNISSQEVKIGKIFVEKNRPMNINP